MQPHFLNKYSHVQRYGKTFRSGLGQINRVASQIGCGSKHVILSGLKQVRINQVAGWVGLTRIFHMIFFFFIKKKSCIYYLESHATNYLM